MSYQNYLISKHWKLKRADCLSHRGNYCRICWSNNNLHIHHMRYTKNGKSILKNEPKGCLIPICGRCHGLIHKYYGSDVKWRFKHYQRANRLYINGLSIDESIRFCRTASVYRAAMSHLTGVK